MILSLIKELILSIIYSYGIIILNINHLTTTNSTSTATTTSTTPSAIASTLIFESKAAVNGTNDVMPTNNQSHLGRFFDPVTVQKHYFECSCGFSENNIGKGLHTVKCNICGMSQHAECMNYDLTNSHRGEYLCPHCHALHVSMKFVWSTMFYFGKNKTKTFYIFDCDSIFVMYHIWSLLLKFPVLL